MEVKTSELTGAALNWAVASIEWPNDTGILNPELTSKQSVNEDYPFDKNWSLAGPIIEREFVCADYIHKSRWLAVKRNGDDAYADAGPMIAGPTLLIAAMRCLIASKLGDKVEIPDHLL